MSRDETNTGKLIVFEGPDGVGKSTVSAAAAEYLEGIGESSVLLAFPGRQPGTVGSLVYDIHHNPASFGVSGMTEASRQALHIAAHLDAIERLIVPTLETGRHVLLDRYWWSTWVYGLVGGIDRRLLSAMIEVERAQWGKIHPALVFLLRRRTRVDREVEPSHWRSLQREYDRLARREKRLHPVHVVENTTEINGTIAEVNAVVGSLISTAVLAPKAVQRSTTQLHLDFDNNSLPRHSTLTAKRRVGPTKPTAVFDTYWRFAAERQQVFFRRLEGTPPPWTADPILARHKFTNAFRASDRVSQYLIRHVIYRDDLPQSADEVFFRILLFKLFNKIETWELLQERFGDLTYASYRFDHYDAVLTRALTSGTRIYSAAYIMPPGRSVLGDRAKHRNHLRLIERMMRDQVPKQVSEANSMRQAFEILRAYPTIGDFLAFQFITDVNYSQLTEFTEMEFVVPGPGAAEGLRKCFDDWGGLSGEELIRFITDRQEEEFAERGLEFPSLWGRRLQLVDCQNLLCEVDKYARVAHPDVAGRTGRSRIKQLFAPSDRQINYWFPPKWGINRVAEAGQARSPVLGRPLRDPISVVDGLYGVT